MRSEPSTIWNQVTVPSKPRSVSYWLSPASHHSLTMCSPLPTEVEVVVIGGGVMGVSTAYWLARFGADVLLLESRDLAFGASGRNGGLVLGDDASLSEIRAVLREEGIVADYEEPGHLSLA